MSIVEAMIPSEEIFVPTRSRLGDIELRAAFEAFIRADEFIPEWAVQVILNHPEESPDMLVQVVDTCGDTLCTANDCLSQGHINGLYLLAVMQAAEAYGSVVSALLLYEDFYDEFFRLDRPAILARLVDSPDHWLDCIFGSSSDERAALIVEATPHLVYSGILERQMASDNLLQAAQSQKLSINSERLLPALVDAISALAVPSALEPLSTLLSQSTIQLPAPQADFAERFKDPEETFRKTMEHCRQLEITDFFECMQRKATREHFGSVADNLHDALQKLHQPKLTDTEALGLFRCFTRFPRESTPPLLEFFRTSLSEDLADTSIPQRNKAAIVEQVLMQLVMNGCREVLPLVIDALHGWMGTLNANHPLCMHLTISHVVGRLADSPEQVIEWAFQLVHRTEVADGLLEAVPIMVYEELATREHCVAALRARLHEAYETNSETLNGIASALIALGDTGENGEVIRFAFERRLQLSDWVVNGTSASSALADIPEAVAQSAKRYFFQERIDSVAARLKAVIYTDPMTFEFDEIEEGDSNWNIGNMPEHLNFDPAEYAVALDRHVAEVAKEFTLLEGTADEVAAYIRNATLQLLNGMSDTERRRWKRGVLTLDQPGLPPGLARNAFRPEEPEHNHGPMTIRNSGPKIGRNDPCPCGSGRKYKKCCGQ